MSRKDAGSCKPTALSWWRVFGGEITRVATLIFPSSDARLCFMCVSLFADSPQIYEEPSPSTLYSVSISRSLCLSLLKSVYLAGSSAWSSWIVITKLSYWLLIWGKTHVILKNRRNSAPESVLILGSAEQAESVENLMPLHGLFWCVMAGVNFITDTSVNLWNNGTSDTQQLIIIKQIILIFANLCAHLDEDCTKIRNYKCLCWYLFILLHSVSIPPFPQCKESECFGS